jgi:hypothetical protein
MVFIGVVTLKVFTLKRPKTACWRWVDKLQFRSAAGLMVALRLVFSGAQVVVAIGLSCVASFNSLPSPPGNG